VDDSRTFEQALAWVRNEAERQGTIDLAEVDDPRAHIQEHFQLHEDANRYGVYVVLRTSPVEVLYIGKAGTLGTNGQFGGQGILGRLTNTRGDIPANQWYRTLAQDGPLAIEYLILPEPRSLSPAFAEATLLQAYLHERGCLPPANKKF